MKDRNGETIFCMRCGSRKAKQYARAGSEDYECAEGGCEPKPQQKSDGQR